MSSSLSGHGGLMEENRWQRALRALDMVFEKGKIAPPLPLDQAKANDLYIAVSQSVDMVATANFAAKFRDGSLPEHIIFELDMGSEEVSDAMERLWKVYFRKQNADRFEVTKALARIFELIGGRQAQRLGGSALPTPDRSSRSRSIKSVKQEPGEKSFQPFPHAPVIWSGSTGARDEPIVISDDEDDPDDDSHNGDVDVDDISDTRDVQAEHAADQGAIVGDQPMHEQIHEEMPIDAEEHKEKEIEEAEGKEKDEPDAEEQEAPQRLHSQPAPPAQTPRDAPLELKENDIAAPLTKAPAPARSAVSPSHSPELETQPRPVLPTLTLSAEVKPYQFNTPERSNKRKRSEELSAKQIRERKVRDVAEEKQGSRQRGLTHVLQRLAESLPWLKADPRAASILQAIHELFKIYDVEKGYVHYDKHAPIRIGVSGNTATEGMIKMFKAIYDMHDAALPAPNSTNSNDSMHQDASGTQQ